MTDKQQKLVAQLEKSGVRVSVKLNRGRPKGLGPQAQKALVMLRNNPRSTCAEIGKLCGLSGERVRQLRAKFNCKRK